ncbi:MAG: helix-turn-helix transcriptional regulator [Chthonomonas sp.]|nr:helix-turn-helix transcriptional regulator [Chthonomonas sp.]
MPGQHRRQPLHEEEHRLRGAISRLRGEQGLSQRQLSTRLGWHPMTVGKIERGERGVAVIELIAIAGALGVSPVDLLLSALE